MLYPLVQKNILRIIGQKPEYRIENGLHHPSSIYLYLALKLYD